MIKTKAQYTLSKITHVLIHLLEELIIGKTISEIPRLFDRFLFGVDSISLTTEKSEIRKGEVVRLYGNAYNRGQPAPNKILVMCRDNQPVSHVITDKSGGYAYEEVLKQEGTHSYYVRTPTIIEYLIIKSRLNVRTPTIIEYLIIKSRLKKFKKMYVNIVLFS